MRSDHRPGQRASGAGPHAGQCVRARLAQRALGDGALRRSKLVVLVDELGRIEGLGVDIEGVRVDVGRLRLLFSSSSFSMISPHISYRNVDLTTSQIWSI